VKVAVTVLLGVLVILAPYFAAVPDDPQNTAPLLWTSSLCAGTLLAAFIAVLAASRGDKSFWSRPTRAETAFLILLGLAFLSMLCRLVVQQGTEYFGQMLRGWAVLATSFAAFSLARRVGAERRALYGLVFAAVVGSVIVADLGVQEYISHVRAGSTYARTFATSTPDYLAGYFVIVLPVTFALFLTALATRALPPLLRGLAAFALGLCLLFQLATLLTTGSRGALGSLTAAALVFAVCLYCAMRSGLVLEKSTRFMLGVLTLGLVLGGLAVARPVIGRLHTLNDNSAAFRVWTWKGAVKMAVANPIMGTGIGTWSDLYRPYALTAPTGAAHNSYLQLADECGLPALIALLVTLGCLGASLTHGLTAAPTAAPTDVLIPAIPSKTEYLPTDHRLLLCGLIAALAGGIIQNLIDSDWYVFFLGIVFWTLAGVAAGIALPLSATLQGRPRRTVLLATGSVAAAFTALTAAQGIAAFYAVQAVEQAPKDAPGAARTYSAARAWDPLNARYPSDQGYQVYFQRSGDPLSAEPALRAAIALEPNPRNYRRLGDVLQALGRQAEALETYEAGLRTDPKSLDLLMALARLNPTPRSFEFYRRISNLELTPVGTVRALGEYTETKFAVADTVMGDQAAKTDARQALAYYARAAQVLEQYADRGGSLNSQQIVLNGGHPNPHQDSEMGGLYQHVLSAWISLAPPDERATLQQRGEKYRQIYGALFAQSSK